uniref:Trichome birefringence-like N-terminal domain-containing protein n=3 Tax=Aegilops tauschii subsp. strangulata TaxID=200361 RepID=A0A453PP31_AEGTS
AVRPHGQSGGGNSGGVRGGNSESSNATAAVGARTNGSSPGQQSGGGGAVPGGNSGGVRTDNPATGNAAASAARSDAPPRDHAGGGEAASNSSGIAAAAPNNSSGIAAAEAKAGATIGGSAQTGTTAKGGAPVRINGSEVNASSAEATASNGTAIPSVNQTRSAVSAMLHGNVAAPHRRGHPGKNHTAQDSAAHHDQQQSVNRAAVASGGSNSTKTMHKEATAPSQGSAGLVKGHAAQATNSSAVPVMGNRHPAKEAANAGGQTKKLHSIEAMGRCDMFYGNWVRDDSYPLYPEGSCPHVDESFNCHLNGRPDKAYQRLRWQPRGCSIPR